MSADDILIAQAERERRRSSFWKTPTASVHANAVAERPSQPEPVRASADGDALDHYALLRQHLAAESRSSDGTKQCCVCGNQEQLRPIAPGGIYACPEHDPGSDLT